jgi:putative SOS response-associated peptidase YedK
VCGRFSLTASGEELAEAFGLDEPPALAPRYNIAPGQPLLVVRRQQGRSRADTLRWGFPGGAPDGPELLINARSETAATRQAFRESFRSRRCLIPADGFYEWKRGRDGSDPYHVRRRDQRVFAFAGLWTPPPPGAAGAEPGACLILTTEANDLVAPIHERMPVILPPEAYAAWLEDAPEKRTAALEDLLRPFPAARLEARAVSPAVNSAANEGPQCQAPAPPRPRQGLLFPESDPR